MPTQIIDSFDLNSNKPLDSRFVVGTASFYVNKDNIQYKYPGLRIWDLNDSLPYVWTGVTWSNESSTGAVSVQGSGGTAGYISKFIGSSPTTIITNSIIFDNGSGKIGINTASPTVTFDVNGVIKGTSFTGIGSSITNINAANIATGLLAIARLSYGSSTQVLLGGGSSAIWTNLSSVAVGSSTNATNIGITNNIGSSSSWNIAFVSTTTGNLPVNVSGSRLQYQPSSGQLLMYSGTVALPSISFVGDTNTGIYRPAADQVAISVNGVQTLLVTSNGLSTVGQLILDSAGSGFISLRFANDTTSGIFRISANRIGVAITGSVKMAISSGNITFGADSLGSPYIRTGNNTSPTLPSFTWWGNDECGIYRPSQDVIGLTTQGVDRILISTNGLAIGQYGSPIRRALFGNITINIDGSGAVINNGSGFTLNMVDSGSTARVRVIFDNAFSTSNMAIHVTQITNSTTTTSYPSTWTTTYFEIQTIGFSSGSLILHFSLFEIS